MLTNIGHSIQSFVLVISDDAASFGGGSSSPTSSFMNVVQKNSDGFMYT